MISVDGFIVDAQWLPRLIQEEAYRKGLIPIYPKTHLSISKVYKVTHTHLARTESYVRVHEVHWKCKFRPVLNL